MKAKSKAFLEVGINSLFFIIVLGMFFVSKKYDFVEGTILGARTFPMMKLFQLNVPLHILMN